METTQGRPIKKLQIAVDNSGWSWEVQDGEDWEMLSVDDIDKINQNLVKKGVKVDKNTLEFPLAQVLCG